MNKREDIIAICMLISIILFMIGYYMAPTWAKFILLAWLLNPKEDELKRYNRFTCDKCGRKFKSNRALQIHKGHIRNKIKT